ncbi:MAG TPA: tRNA (adenosine(37)-N6)-threonylcarbamoyltransferase complex ATPase subunit type 1 TsaE [Steroidobacteraceae bacterium]|nr:tRNA (adenosine(37)-N6)-threonylcarbamoyltransferase complex ATPase subunit type 1 TsaE [Steroidobacteraceae bacterium]
MVATTAEATAACGARLARALPAGHPQALQLHLQGDLGAGKTTLARGFLQALGYSGVVRSPTYTLVETYALGAVTVVHADLYRLLDADEFEGLGLRDLAQGGHVWLIEWPQRAGRWLPAADINVTLQAQAAFHSIELVAPTAVGAQWLSYLHA